MGVKSRMKLTEYTRRWVLNQVSKYGEQIGILEEDMPKVIFTRKEVLTMPIQLTRGRRTVTHKCYGICFYDAKTILIISKSSNLSIE